MPGTGETLDELVVQQARRTPEAVAVKDDLQELSYARLAEQAQALAGELVAAGVVPGSPVLICANRSVALPVALLGTLLSGGAFLPVDPRWPAARIAHIVGEVAPAAAVADDEYHSLFSGVFTGAVIDPRPDQSVAGHRASGTSGQQTPRAGVNRDDARSAYIIYTSGSTGRPKGVAVPHRAIVNKLQWMRRQYGFGMHDRVVHKTPYTFDVSLWELFVPLIAGGVLVMAPPGIHQDPRELVTFVRRTRATAIHFVPSMLAAFLAEEGAEGCRSLTRLFASGEALSPALANRAQKVLGGASLHNLYGPTEAAVHVTHWPCRRTEPGPSVPIGYPINGVIAKVLDGDRRPVSVGEPGELYLGGICLASGYVGRPDLTAAAFVPDPARPGQLLYRTGDLARWSDGGWLEYLGRLDRQVKLRGTRIELGEIEVVAAEHPAVGTAVAIVRDDLGSLSRLVLYVVPRPGTPLNGGELSAHLKTRLPEYMMPAFVVELDRIPVTANGKCDHDALPVPKRQSTADSARRRRRRERPVTVLAPHPTPVIASTGGKAAPKFTYEGAARYPAHALQRQMWSLDQVEGGTVAYAVAYAWRLSGPLDEERLSAAVDALVARHDALRTTFELVGRSLDAVVHPPRAGHLRIEDLARPDPQDAEAEMMNRVSREAHDPFDLREGPVFRARLYRLGSSSAVLLLCVHHIAVDAGSEPIITRDLTVLYDGMDAMPPAVSGSEVVALLGTSGLANADDVPVERIAYWRDALAGAPRQANLPVDRPSGDRSDPRGEHLTLDLSMVDPIRVQDACKRFRVTPFVLFLAAHVITLASWCGQDDVVTGVPVLHRDADELQDVVGMFVGSLPVRVRLQGVTAMSDSVLRVRDAVFDAIEHRGIPFQTIVREAAPGREVGVHPVFQTLFIFSTVDRMNLRLGSASATPMDIPFQTTMFDLTLDVRQESGAFTAAIVYRTSLLERATIAALAGRYLEVLQTMLVD
jgi:amino acid adenylation domain-containing protein